MPQLFNVIKCFQCLIFQVDINKKSTNKWTCKVCSAKQSYKQGEAKECRLRVQSMNKIKHEVKNEVDSNRLKAGEEFSRNFQLFPSSTTDNASSSPLVEKTNDNEYPGASVQENIAKGSKTSKWAKYLNDEDS